MTDAVLIALAESFSPAQRESLRDFVTEIGELRSEEEVAAGALVSCACLRFFLRTSDNLVALRRSASQFFPQFDFAVRTQAAYQVPPKLVAFDMDSTLITCEVIDELAKLAGVGEQVSAVTAAAMRGEIDFQQSFRQRIALLRGLPAQEVERLLGSICISPGAESLFRTLRKKGVKTAVLSGGFSFVGRMLQRKLGVDFVHTNELDLTNSSVAGTVTSAIIDGAGKAAHLERIASELGIPLNQTVAVGDGANDLAMLQLAGLGVAYRAKLALREQAEAVIDHSPLDGVLYFAPSL